MEFDDLAEIIFMLATSWDAIRLKKQGNIIMLSTKR
jgi:hypothetical protein